VLRSGEAISLEQSEQSEIPVTKPEDLKVQKSLSKIKHVIIIMSGKGGVGKSTVAANLAVALSMRGYETGLMDADIHGPNIPKMLKIEDAIITGDKDGLFPVIVPPHLKVISMAFLLQDRDTPVIWRGPMKMGAIKQFIGDVKWGELDYLIVDLPPGTGDEPLSIAQLIPNTDGSIIVTTPQEVALLDSRKSVNFSKSLKIPVLGIIENMSGLICPYCGNKIDLFKTGGGKTASEELDVPFLGEVPLDPNVVQSGDDGMPIVLYDSDSRASKAFLEIVERVIESIKEK
jgi:ATP-binding protein involved in chromosome partitioning